MRRKEIRGKFENRKSGELFCMDAKLFHARHQSGSIDAHSRGSPVSTTDATLGSLQDAYDLPALFLIVLLAGTFHGALIQGTDRFFDNQGNILSTRAAVVDG